MTPPRWLSALAVLCSVATGALAQEEVPFITTPDRVTVEMLKLANVGPKDFVLDLGSGDGRIVITAARRFGARGLGVEIVPDLVAVSRRNAERAGVGERAQFREQDLFKTDLGVASVITMYLLPEVNLQLRPALLALAPGTRIVSHDWDLGDWAPERTLTVDAPDKPVGREKLSRLHLWIVPAAVEGTWCGPRALQWQLQRRYQWVEGRAGTGRDLRAVQGRITGTTVHLWAPGAAVQAQLVNGSMRVVSASGAWSSWRGRPLTPGGPGGCSS